MATSVDVVRRVAGSERRLSYLADLKVRPSARHKGLAGRLMRRAARDLARDRVPAFGIVLAGNRAMAPLLGEAGAELSFRPMARMRNYSVFIAHARGRRGRRDIAVRRAAPRDTGDLVALWNRLQLERELSPVWDEASFRQHIDATPGLDLERFWVAERAGRPVAFAAAWDASAIKQLRLLSLPWGLRFLRPAYNGAARWFENPSIPSDGEIISLAYVTHFCAETADDLRALIARIRAELTGSRYLYLDLALDVRDPLTRALDGVPKTSLDFDLHWVTPRNMDPPELRRGPVLFDMSIV